MPDVGHADGGDSLLDLLKRSGILAPAADAEALRELSRGLTEARRTDGGGADGDSLLVHDHFFYLHESNPRSSP